MSEQLTIQKPGDLLRFLERSKSAIAMALPKHLTPERMMRLTLTCFSTNPGLRKCTPNSILASVVVASQIGLEIGIAGQGYLIPYKDTCTFVPGWQGLVGLLNNTGRATAWTGAVFEGDEFDFRLGSSPRCHHVPGENFGDPDKMTWVYACGKVNGSEQPVIEAWPMKRVWKHRDQFNKVGRRHYSFEHPEMYARKAVLMQVLKYMPRSIELNNAITAADAAEAGKVIKVDEGMIVEVATEEAEPAERPDVINPFRREEGADGPVALEIENSQRVAPDAGSNREDVLNKILSDLDFFGVSVPSFEGACRKSGLMRGAEMLSALPVEKLQAIFEVGVTVICETIGQSGKGDGK